MGLLTSVLYACLAVFGLGWYFNRWSGNFSLLLFILTVITFAYWLAERIPSTREQALRLGLVTIDQMLDALVDAVACPVSGIRTVEVPAIRSASGRG